MAGWLLFAGTASIQSLVSLSASRLDAVILMCLRRALREAGAFALGSVASGLVGRCANSGSHIAFSFGVCGHVVYSGAIGLVVTEAIICPL